MINELGFDINKLLTVKRERIPIDQNDWPRCEQCSMPVEQFYVEEGEGALSIVAVCHGDREVVELPDEVLETLLGNSKLTVGPAFTGEQIYADVTGK